MDKYRQGSVRSERHGGGCPYLAECWSWRFISIFRSTIGQIVNRGRVGSEYGRGGGVGVKEAVTSGSVGIFYTLRFISISLSFATIPDVTWDDVGALSGVRKELEMKILAPIRHPGFFSLFVSSVLTLFFLKRKVQSVWTRAVFRSIDVWTSRMRKNSSR